jgi:MFS family permease
MDLVAAGSSPGDAAATAIEPPRQDWRLVVLIFWVTSLVEGIGLSQIFAFVPLYLRDMGVPEPDRLRFVGIFGSLIFVVGAPLVPLWGVWADKYSRKAVIARSAVVEAVVFAGVALSREPWQLALSMLLVGLQLGNTGVMLAAIRDVAPRARLATIIAIFGASGPIGFAMGPVLGGLIVDGLGLPLSAVFWLSSALSVGTALLVGVGSREVRPEVVPKGRVVHLAFGAIRAVLADPSVRRIFAIFGVAFLGSQMSRPFIPVVVERVVPDATGLASAIALVTGAAALVGALVSPLGGWIGDRVGFRPVLVAALVGGGAALLAMPVVGTIPLLALAAVALAAFGAAINAMVFGLLATEVPSERRSATLNLVYLPLYAAGIVGPTIGALVVGVGLWAPFWVAGAIYLAGAVALAMRRARSSDAIPAGG